jgi:uncharacterized oligopeptide transporter (OPT) family protein
MLTIAAGVFLGIVALFIFLVVLCVIGIIHFDNVDRKSRYSSP